MVQTLTGSINFYVADEVQLDWDEYAEHVMFSINTAEN